MMLTITELRTIITDIAFLSFLVLCVVAFMQYLGDRYGKK